MQNMGEIPLKFGGQGEREGQGEGNYLQCSWGDQVRRPPGDELPTPGGCLAGRLWPLTLAEVELGVPAPRLLESSKLEAPVSTEGCPVLASTQPPALSPLPCSWPGVPGTGRRCGHHKDCSLLWRQTQPALRHQPRTRSVHGPAPAHLRHARLSRPPDTRQSLLTSREILKDPARPLNTAARPREIPRDHVKSRETTRNPARSLSSGKGSHVGCPIVPVSVVLEFT